MTTTTTHVLLALALAATPAVAALPQHTHPAGHAQQAMGFDQQKATHHFRLQADGGTIEVTANAESDRTSIDQIRAHLRHIAAAFQRGDFEIPLLVHGKEPPGVDVMKARRGSIAYRFEELPAGAKVVVRTADDTARHAVHEFLRFQIREHRTGDPLQPIMNAK